MSTREVRVTELVGRRVRDAAGRSVGRIEELVCGIELRPEGGRDYVVREIHLGAFGVLEALTGGTLLRLLVRTIGHGAGYKRYVVPWEQMDFTDVERPRMRVATETLSVIG